MNKKHYLTLTRLKHLTTLFICICLKTLNLNAQSALLPTHFQNQLVSDTWDEPVGVRFDGNGQMYVWEKGGKVWVVDTNGITVSPPLLDISEEVGNWRDHGLLGFALDPNFLSNGFFYVSYAVDRHHLLYYGTPSYNPNANDYFKATIARVVRYQANPATNFTTLVPGSRLVLIGETKKTGIPVLHLSHSVGQLQFGTDGSLLVATGDGASYNGLDTGVSNQSYWQMALNDSIITEAENIGCFRSQFIHSLNGKILRIDPSSGNGLPTNPFYDPSNPRSAASRTWALGLRNPYRMVVKPNSGSTDITAGNPGIIYLGDVGWNNFEEFNICHSPGQNFGWPVYEGFRFIAGYNNAAPKNLFAPNPLYGTIPGCESHFRFSHLLINQTLNPPSWPNPCSPSVQIPANIPKFMHSRPQLDWSHDSVYTRTGIFVNNNPAVVSITAPNSPVQGLPFQGFASVGGAFYTGSRYPQNFQQCYFHTDYVGGWIKIFKVDSSSKIVAIEDFAEDLGPVVHLEYNPKDEMIYYVMYPNSIYRIRYNGLVHNPPTAVAKANKNYGISSLKVKFNGMQSSDPDQDSLLYHWDFGDGSTSNEINPVHEFVTASNAPVTYNVKLTVTDTSGLSDTDSLKIFLNNTPPQVQISSITNGQLYSVSFPSTISLQANVYDAEHDSDHLYYKWFVTLHHNQHTHPEAADTNKITQAVITPTDCNPLETYFYRVRLLVTDQEGLSGYDEVDLFPACAKPVSQFTANHTGICVNDSVTFTDQTYGLADTYEWYFPGGNPSFSNQQNPTVVYPASGVYDVILITENGGGRDTLIRQSYIDVRTKPQAQITPPGIDSICTGQSLVLTASTGLNLTYQWYLNGQAIPSATQSAFTAVQAGDYQVTVSRSNGCSRTSGIKTIIEKYISAEIFIDGNTNHCYDSVTFKADAPLAVAYQWMRNGILLPYANQPEYKTMAPGKYAVMVYSADGCSVSSNSIRLNYCSANAYLKTGIESAPDFELYPNPATDYFIFKWKDEFKKARFTLTDATGKKIALRSVADSVEMNELRFNLDGVTQGIYMLHILTENESRFMPLAVIR